MESLSCSHCGLRFRTPLRAAAARGPAFCCSGCAIAATLLAADPGSPGHARKSLIRLGLAAFFSANVMVLTLFLYSGDPAPAFALALVRALLLCLSAPVFLLLAPPFLRGMVRDLRRARLSMDSLISLGAGAAFAYSCASVVRGSGAVYFDTAAMILLLVTAGRLIEAYARVHSRRSLRDLLEKQAGKARVSRAGAWVEAHSREVAPGETVRVLAGERIPVDGPVLAGSASVDASAITGEPGPCAIASGDQVFAGSVCLDGMLDIECAAAGGDSLLARVASAVEQARLTPAPSERMADSLAAILTPLTLALAAVAVAVHWRHGVEGAATTGLAVLVVACPCALGIAVPLVHVIALSAAAARGVVIRSAEA
ncbi:MAG: HAD-IC family P-type ATPase, partial [Acidobacteriia bacterium]|nr:HAD-IC family P-type ATPase [Terriglobia bacterium]